MIINQVGGGNKPDVLDNQLIGSNLPLRVIFEEYSNIGTRYSGAFSGVRMDNGGTVLMGDKHLYQSFEKTDITTTESGYGPSKTVSLSTHITSSPSTTLPLFDKTSVGEKKGSGLMFVYFSAGYPGLVLPNPTTKRYESYGIYTKFTFDFTDGKDIIIPETTSVGGSDLRQIGYSEGKPHSGVIGYIMTATFE